MIYLDFETCGFHGMGVLLQWAEDDGPVHLHDIWLRPIRETLELIEWICSKDICGFNLVFDFFHLIKIYTTFRLFPDKDAIPEDHIEAIAILEERARFSDVCLKPRSAFDVMLHARKGPYQSLMNRDDIRIRRVPTAIAHHLARELEKRIKFEDIYFARTKDKYAPRWKVFDIKDAEGRINCDFKDIKLTFKASGSLKNLYRHAFGEKEIIEFGDISIDKKMNPVELGYAPFALAVGTPEDWKGSWPDVISHHIGHWGYSKQARKYASDDVVYTRRLYKEHFNSPEIGDDDSILSCSVAACRWRGYAINIQAILKLRDAAVEKVTKLSRFAGKKANGKRTSAMPPRAAKRYLYEVMDSAEVAAMHNSTKKTVLETIEKFKSDCPDCINELNPDCPNCKGSGIIRHPAAIRAQEILEAREAESEIKIYDKLLKAGRFHASFVVIGALSSRMSGANGLNPQGIKHQKYVREAFTLADTYIEPIETVRIQIDDTDHEISIEKLSMCLCGGDFKSFEVSIAVKVFNDRILDETLNSGKKIHALLGMELFPGKTYQEIVDSDGTDNDMYDKGKKGVFLMFYGGDPNTFKNKLGIELEIGIPAFERFQNKFKGIKVFGAWVQDKFGSLRQTGGIGTKIEWHEPADYAESFIGFRRYFTLENRIARTLFQIAQDPPPSLKGAKIKVMRRDRMQTASGACQSALYGAAFGITSAIIRAAKNHYIQSPGAQITKGVQRAIWNLQPSGVGPWLVQILNVHDELMCPMKDGMQQKVQDVVNAKVIEFKTQVPLLAIDWFKNIPNWASKKG